jgi:hypothetical protein
LVVVLRCFEWFCVRVVAVLRSSGLSCLRVRDLLFRTLELWALLDETESSAMCRVVVVVGYGEQRKR